MVICQLLFKETRAKPYRFELVTHQFLQLLMDGSVGESGKGDLPDAFWVWLLVGTDQESYDT